MVKVNDFEAHTWNLVSIKRQNLRSTQLLSSAVFAISSISRGLLFVVNSVNSSESCWVKGEWGLRQTHLFPYGLGMPISH